MNSFSKTEAANFPIQASVDLEPVYDIAPPRGNFQGYDFLNPHGSGHSLVKVCKVLLGH